MISQLDGASHQDLNHQVKTMRKYIKTHVILTLSTHRDNNKRYNGQIVQVSKQKQSKKKHTKKKVQAASYNIRIRYDDGDVEFATYPDPDIRLLSME